MATAPPKTRTDAIRRVREAKPLWLGLDAFVLAAVGQTLLVHEAARGFGAALLLLGVAMAMVAYHGMRDRPPSSAHPLAVRSHRGRAWPVAGIASSGVLAASSVVAYRADSDALFGVHGVLWLLGMAVLIVSCAFWPPRDSTDAEARQPWTPRERLVFAGLLVLSLFTHLAFLEQIPWRWHFDEAFAFTETMRYYRGPRIPLFTTTWHETSLPSLWFGFAAGGMYLFGPGLAGVRAGTAIVGALTVIPVYGIARQAWGRLAAALAAFGIAASAVSVHYSRVSINNVTTAFAWAVCVHFLLRGLGGHRPLDFAYAGVAAGISMYTYYGTRLLPCLLGVFLTYMLACHVRAFRAHVGHFAVLAIGFLAGFGPLLGYFIDHPWMWSSRATAMLNVPPVIPATWQGWLDDWNILAPLAARNLLGFGVLSSRDTVYFAPFLLPAEAAVLALGGGVLVARWRQPASFLVLLWGASVVLLSTLLDHTTIPNFAHWAPAFPAFYLVMALPLSLWLTALARRPNRALRMLAAALLVVLLGGDLCANTYAYLVAYPPRVPPDRSLEALQGRYLASQGPDTRVFIVGPSWQPLKPEGAAMMAPTTPAKDLLYPDRELPLVGDARLNLAFLVYNDVQTSMPAIEQYYPGGTWSDVSTPDGSVVARSYRVGAAQAMSRYGVQVWIDHGETDARSGRPTVRQRVSKVGQVPTDSAPAYPARLSWEGRLYVPAGGPPHLVLDGATEPVLHVEGRVTPLGSALPVGAGWCGFRVTATVDGMTPVRLLMRQGDGSAAEVDTGSLWPSR